jgi:hypothetical protein
VHRISPSATRGSGADTGPLVAMLNAKDLHHEPRTPLSRRFRGAGAERLAERARPRLTGLSFRRADAVHYETCGDLRCAPETGRPGWSCGHPLGRLPWGRCHGATGYIFRFREVRGSRRPSVHLDRIRYTCAMKFTVADLVATLAASPEESYVRVVADWLAHGEVAAAGPALTGQAIGRPAP